MELIYKRHSGFTLIELLVAITILAIVSSIGLTTYSNAQIVARDAKRQQDLKAVATALVVYYQSQATHAYPARTTWSGPNSLETDLNPPNYINQMPVPPTAGDYSYNGSAITYSLCAKLENKTAPDGSGVESCNTNCGGLSTNKCFHLANP